MIQSPVKNHGRKQQSWLAASWSKAAPITAAVLASLLISATGHSAPPELQGNQLVRDGQRLILNADTPWTLPVQLTKAQTIDYLDRRQAQGVNAIMVEIVEEDQWAGPLNAEGHHPFVGPWFETPNEPYWEHIDWLIAQSDARNIIVIFQPTFLGFTCGDFSPVGGQGVCARVREAGPTVMQAFGVWLGSRYRDSDNIIYVYGGDTALNGTSVPPAHEAMIAGIASADDRHLTSYHCYRNISGDECYSAVDLNTAYSDCTNTPTKLQEAFATGRPFYYVEGEYNGGVCGRSQAYWTILMGGVGHVYGNGGVWEFNPGWEFYMDDGDFMRHLADLVASRPPGDPAPQLMTSGTMADADYAATAASANSVVSYIPTGRAVTLSVPFGSGRVWWFNPRNGNAQAVGEFNGVVSISTPSSDDWVLVIDDAALNLPAPGAGPADQLFMDGFE